VKKVTLCIICFFVVIRIFGQSDSSVVYFTKDISQEGLLKVFSFVEAETVGKIGFKVHFGEEGNKNYLSPELMKPLVQKLNATLVETNVLYVSKRRYTQSHIQLAKEHGFTYAPIDILDSEKDTAIIANTNHFKKVLTGSHFFNYDSYVILSHFKGHGSSGFGGAIKNVGMGMASIAGKMALHASDVPKTFPDKCTKCGACVKECPAGAITLNPLTIDKSKCIGCGKCIGVCPVQSFSVPWGSTEESVFLERLVEYAKILSEQKKMIYINVLANISKSCDCARNAPEPFLEDIGILVSTDIVAIDKASHDMVDKACKCDDAFVKAGNPSGKHQIDYAAELKMGVKEYKLIVIDK
jgi:uncharacterized protein